DALARVAADWDAERTRGTRLRVEPVLRMRPLPTAIYHLLDPVADPVFTMVLGNDSGEPRRVCVKAYLEDLSGEDVRTVDLEPDREIRFNVRPPLLPERVRAITAERWTTWHLIVEDLDRGGTIERHEGVEVPCLPPSSGLNGVVRPETGQLIDLTCYYAAWVTPYAEAVQERIRRAAELVPDGMIRGYQGDVKSVTRQVKALYQSLREAGLAYVNSVIDFGAPAALSPQRPRLPRESLAQKSVNCLDGIVLFASLLEGASLNPALVFVPGHAFVGWETGNGSGQWRYLETTMIGRAEFEAA